MDGGVRKPWRYAAAGTLVVVTAVGLYLVARSPHRSDLESFAGLVISVAGVVAGWIAWVWRSRNGQASEVFSAPELGRLTDLLAGAVEDEWTRAAGERGLLEPEPIPVRWQRPAAPYAGPAGAAVASARFGPLPGLTAIGEQRLLGGTVAELHEVYGGLGSGRLLVAGGPGSGKSGAAVLLILAALHYRKGVSGKARPKVPVPVMFTLQGWDPRTQRVEDWLAGCLLQTYALFGGKQGVTIARGMLREGRIAVFLDGLDEIPEDLRPVVLSALNQQATTFRLVLLSRSAEMAAAAAQALVQGAAAIELQDIDPRTAADYLTRTQLAPLPQGWQELTSHLRQEPASPLVRALSNPLMLTLVRDTFRAGDDAGELLDLRDAAGRPASSEDIAGYVLDRVLPAAYTQYPGDFPPRYDLSTAEHTLRRIATRMDQAGTRDLRWWGVPAWVPAAPRVVMTWLGAVAMFGLAVGLTSGVIAGPGAALAGGLGYGLLAGLVAGLALGSGNKTPKRLAPIRWRQMLRRRPLVAGLLTGLAFGLAAQGTLSLQAEPVAGLVADLRNPLPAGLAFGLVAWLAAGLIAGASQPGTDNSSPLSPVLSWRNDRTFGLANGLAVGLAVGLTIVLAVLLFFTAPGGFTSALTGALIAALVAGLVIGLLVGFVYPQTWRASLAFGQLAVSDGTPVRLMRFLEDARSRNVLRTVGPVYQFRHARLQDRLAAHEVPARQGRDESWSPAQATTPPAARTGAQADTC